jgi:N-alpha-acetyl-L-2,4-diaminobutyrate deacetylase
LAAAIHHGQLRGTIEKIAYHKSGTQRKLEMVQRECFSVAPFDGHYEPLVECGTEVQAGDVVGLLHDFNRIDLPAHEVRAGLAGVVLAQAWVAPIRQGQHIVVVGKVIS